MNVVKKYLSFAITYFLVVLSPESFASSVSLIEELEEVRVLSQKITKNYFYVHQNIRSLKAGNQISEDMDRLDSLVQSLGKKRLSKTSDNLMLFIEFTVSDMKSVVSEPYSLMNGALMIDFGESILEGVDAILEKEIQTQKTKTIVLEELKFDLERMTKYYISFRGGFTDENNVKQMEASMASFEQGLAFIRNNFTGSEQQAVALKKVERYWPIAKEFFETIEDSSLPRVVLSSADNLNDSLDLLLHSERSVH